MYGQHEANASQLGKKRRCYGSTSLRERERCSSRASNLDHLYHNYVANQYRPETTHSGVERTSNEQLDSEAAHQIPGSLTLLRTLRSPLDPPLNATRLMLHLFVTSSTDMDTKLFTSANIHTIHILVVVEQWNWSYQAVTKQLPYSFYDHTRLISAV